MTDKLFFARMLRAHSTDAERALWRKLRARQLSSTKFRRQVPLGEYIVDFISFSSRVVIELDGGQHAAGPQLERDKIRDHWLRSQGYSVLRFWNSDVLTNMDAVLTRILTAVDQHKMR